MSESNLLKQLEFIKEIDKVKYIERRTKLFHSDRRENDAEHSWHLAMMAMVLSEHANVQINLLKVIKMVLIHDIVEIDAGDTFLFDTKKDHDNNQEERKCAERVFGMLPDKQRDELLGLWEEFEKGSSEEAKFARALDNLEPMLQNATNEGGTWQEFDVGHDVVYDKKKVIAKGSATLWDHAQGILRESVEKGILKK